jgi:hypothetical protein
MVRSAHLGSESLERKRSKKQLKTYRRKDSQMFYQNAPAYGLPNGYANGFANGAYTNGQANGFPGYSAHYPTAGYPTAQIPHGMTTPYGINFPIGYAQAIRPDVYNTPGHELAGLHARIDELRLQIDVLCNLVRQQQVAQAYGLNQVIGAQNFAAQTLTPDGLRNEFPAIPYANSMYNRTAGNVRTRENDSHIILEVFLPHLSMGDVDVEISGNRIICRTRIPVNPAGRWWLNSQLPRGLELFELADGRVEFGWLVPVSFTAKEVEASWRDGFMCIYVPKADVAATRQTVAVVRDSKGRKSADMT